MNYLPTGTTPPATQGAESVTEKFVKAKFTGVGGVITTAGGVAGTFHGYKRNQSVGWALVWGLMGTLFPIPVGVIAVAQGFGKKKGA